MTTDTITRTTAVSVSLNLTTLESLREFCKVLAGTEMVPKVYRDKPDNILVAMVHGQELGLPPLQALQSIAVVNGIPSIYGDAGLALVRGSGKLEDFDEWFEVDGVRQEGSSFPIQQYADAGKMVVAHCMSKRVGSKRPRITTYSVNDAKRAGLWAKEGTWQTVPQRMLMWRPRSWNLRDEFGDVLKGLSIYEEAMDIDMTPGVDGTFRPASDPERVENAAKLEAGREALKQLQENHPVDQLPEENPVEAQSIPETKEPEQNGTPGDSYSQKYHVFAKQLRAAEAAAGIADIMNAALNGPDALLSPDERRSLTVLKDTRMEQLRKPKGKK